MSCPVAESTLTVVSGAFIIMESTNLDETVSTKHLDVREGVRTEQPFVEGMSAMLSELREIIADDVAVTRVKLDRMYLGVPEDDPRIGEYDSLDRRLRSMEARFRWN